MYKIKLSDGTEIKDLELNGNNYISKKIIKDSVFAGNLGTVTITNDKGETQHTNMKLIQNKVAGGQSWFILAEKTKDELEREQLKQENEMLSEAITELSMLISAILGGE